MITNVYCIFIFFTFMLTLTSNATIQSNTIFNDETQSDCNPDGLIDCTDPEVFHLLIMSTMDHFKDVHFYRFGKAVRGGNDSSCDMAWRFKPKHDKTATFLKDYRRFLIKQRKDCSFSVLSIGEYHSGLNARKKKKVHPGFKNSTGTKDQDFSLPYDGDNLPALKSEDEFVHGKYLVYIGGGDRCKDMNHFLWSFSCALGEARYLNRTLVVDLSVCLNSKYTSSGLDEEGKDLRFYFDFEHLKASGSVLEHHQFWSYWDRWNEKNGLKLYYVEDIKVSPMKLKKVKHSLIMRKFGFVEPDNQWYKVCEGKAGSLVKRPWRLIKKSKRLMDVVSAIGNRLSNRYDSVHIVGREDRKVRTNVDVETSPGKLLSALAKKIEDERNVYVATNEPDKSLFNITLKDKYTAHFLDDFKELWEENSEWYTETAKLNSKIPVEFDGYMRLLVDAEVFLRGKRQVRLSII